MARIFNLYAGGAERLTGSCDETNDLPVRLQPDKRVDGGYNYLRHTNWQQLMFELHRVYRLRPKDLKVGDKLRIFVQPNHATLSSLFVDFREYFTGFSFHLRSVVGLELVGDKYTNQVDDNGTAINILKESFDDANDLNAGAGYSTRTQVAFIFQQNPHSAAVDAIELEITDIPSKGIDPDMDIEFARRFTPDGVHL